MDNYFLNFSVRSPNNWWYLNTNWKQKALIELGSIGFSCHFKIDCFLFRLDIWGGVGTMAHLHTKICDWVTYFSLSKSPQITVIPISFYIVHPNLISFYKKPKNNWKVSKIWKNPKILQKITKISKNHLFFKKI